VKLHLYVQEFHLVVIWGIYSLTEATTRRTSLAVIRFVVVTLCRPMFLHTDEHLSSDDAQAKQAREHDGRGVTCTMDRLTTVDTLSTWTSCVQLHRRHVYCRPCSSGSTRQTTSDSWQDSEDEPPCQVCMINDTRQSQQLIFSPHHMHWCGLLLQMSHVACLCDGVLVMRVSCAKAAKPMEMPFVGGGLTYVGLTQCSIALNYGAVNNWLIDWLIDWTSMY